MQKDTRKYLRKFVKSLEKDIEKMIEKKIIEKKNCIKNSKVIIILYKESIKAKIEYESENDFFCLRVEAR